ncbi:exonuclease SbcCD subunit D [Aquipuribacter hungaricus]|uniref:Nuclease SbcCD subunit D n=1 Tax=Aquipuribacter hungaricus TaxID=545624 RepID=A0ABV7WAK8_9MICO
MRMLHTSDWHLGRTLHGADLAAAHEAWVDHVVEVVRAERVDVVLVAGDVFDRAIPPVQALSTWERALLELTRAGARVVVSSGNHDSPARLGAHTGLLSQVGVHVRCDPARVGEPVVIADEHGPVAFTPLPYLEPTTTAALLSRLSVGDEPAGADVARTQEGVVSRAASLAAAGARAAGHTRTVALAHTWVAGVRPADRSDSEREIGCCAARPGDGGTRVGSLDRVGVEAFAPFSYTALGHLHGPQVLGETLRYSGSPVAFSFSERAHRKGSWLVDLDAAGAARVERVDAPVHRPLTQLTGTLEDLLAGAGHTAAEGHHVKAVLTDPARPADAMRRLQARFPHAVALEWVPQGRAPERTAAARLRTSADDTGVAVGFVAHVRGTEASDDERARLDGAFRAVRAAEVAADALPQQRVLDELAAVGTEDEELVLLDLASAGGAAAAREGAA